MRWQVAVCGPRNATDADYIDARRLGERLAELGCTVLCGGGAGVMEAVAAGVRSRDGLVVGIRPDDDPSTASPDLSVRIMTNLGEARNAVLVWSADLVISVGGSWGTFSEVALAKRRGEIPVICLRGWRPVDYMGNAVDGLILADSAEEAVEYARRYFSGDGL